LYHEYAYLVEAKKDRLSDLEKEERDAAGCQTRNVFHEKYEAIIAGLREQVQILKDSRAKTSTQFSRPCRNKRPAGSGITRTGRRHTNHSSKGSSITSIRCPITILSRRGGTRGEAICSCDGDGAGVVQEAVAFLKSRKKRRRCKWGGSRKSAKWDAVEFAAKISSG
jgi:hypothetical protein